MAQPTPKKKRKSRIIWLSLAAIAGLLLIVMVLAGGGEKQEKVYAEEVQKRTIVSSVSESGTVEPVVEVKVAADVSGEVVSMNVKEGMQVKHGEMMVTIRPDNYQSALEVARASVDASKASVLNSKAAVEQAYQRYLTDSVNFQRQDDLLRKKVVSKAEWDAAKLQFDIARSAYKGAQANERAARYQIDSQLASLRSAETDLRKTTIFASMDGTITRQNIKVGERVVGTSMMAGTEMFRIADLSKMQVLVKINENDIVHVKIGDSAHIEIDAYEGRKFKGQVTEIAYSAAVASQTTATDQVTSFEVKVEIDPKSYLSDPKIMRGVMPHQSPFRPGMSAQVQIFTERADNATAIPIQSVTMRRLGDDEKEEPVEVVFVLKDDLTVEMRPVVTGLADDEYIEVLSGLKPGETVVAGPYRVLSKDLIGGMKVEVGNEKESQEADDASSKE